MLLASFTTLAAVHTWLPWCTNTEHVTNVEWPKQKDWISCAPAIGLSGTMLTRTRWSLRGTGKPQQDG